MWGFMGCLPCHGRVDCTRCFETKQLAFDVSKRTEGDWRITHNPLSWGTTTPEVVVLGFSKGPTQAGALASEPHDAIAYKKARLQVGKILAHIGLIPTLESPERIKKEVDRLISDKGGRFHFASLIRCTVEQYDRSKNIWKGSGGGMLDKFMGAEFGDEVTSNCSAGFLRDLPSETRLIVMFGLGSEIKSKKSLSEFSHNYVEAANKLFQKVRPGKWKRVNQVAYTDGTITVVHVEHFTSQGANIPNWLGVYDHPRSQLGRLAKAAVKGSGVQVY